MSIHANKQITKMTSHRQFENKSFTCYKECFEKKQEKYTNTQVRNWLLYNIMIKL